MHDIKTRKRNKKDFIILIITLIFLLTIIVSVVFIIEWKKDSNKTKVLEKNIIEQTKIEEKEDTENVSIIDQPEEIEKSNPYWDYIKMNLINVDFTELKKINEHVKGWIQVSGTNINYPFVQTDNNDFYLKHSFDKSTNRMGWVFMDYRNNITDFNKNTIIYAHGNSDKTMFGSLKNIIQNTWYNNTNNHVIKLSTEYENTLWQVFSVYKIPTTNDYIQTDFTSDEEYQTFLNMLQSRSYFTFNTTIDPTDKILTLSTCWNEEEKVVLHAKLIKKEVR